MKAIRICLCLAAALLLLITGCTGGSNNTAIKGLITVSSKADTEGSLLAQIITLMLEADGFQVNDKPAIVGTSLIRQAILSGEIDIYPEYTGNGAIFFPDVSADTWKNADQSYQTVKNLDKERNNLIWLQAVLGN